MNVAARAEGAEGMWGKDKPMNRRALWTGFVSLIVAGRAMPAEAADCTDRVRKIIADLLGVAIEKVTLRARLREDLGADSLDCVELLIALEEEFKIAIPDDAADKIKTVGEVIAYLRQTVRDCA
jgi:acyl carrier protein